ncbi:hypothetical protein F3I62_19070 [Pseudomonas sp. R-28-1W-6]|uniref:hypothetical protein n=1 Tax=Pseudomonas sp. R-28-1W-6 TaxID=2650101 RepID=UPI001365812A|nr:hypothetical protein [Pseudomonas sp. R-28-1W-6]MWV14208.1 hypothetical protein [Pseudomonas sp. R-28-1W-6]
MPIRMPHVALAAAILLPQAVSAKTKLADCLSLAPTQAQLCASGIDPFARVYRTPAGDLSSTSSFKTTGEYARYADDGADLASPLMGKALENDGALLIAKAGPVDAEELAYELDLKAVPDKTKSWRGAVMASNQGPDVSGRDILTWYHKQRLGEGYVATVSATHGFSDLRPESKGGSYESLFLDLEKAYAFGLVNLSYSYTDNEAGGDSLIYVLGGETQRFSASLSNWYDKTWRFTQKLEHTTREQEMGVFDLYTRQRYTSGILEGAYEGSAGSIQVKAKKGVDGNQEMNLLPLLGTFNPYYWSLDLNATGSFRLTEKTLLKTRLEGFKGSMDMPSSERIGLGGTSAGSSHESGLYSGYKGFQNDISISRQLFTGNGYSVVGHVGTNGADIKTALDQSIRLQSAEIGVDVAFGSWGINTTYAKSVSTKGLDADQRVNAQIVWRY